MASPDRSSPSIDVLRWPFIGPLLRWRHARTTVQLTALTVAAAMILHGLFGPQIAPRNLATVLTWVHYRGLLVLALLAAGNLFCTGCPFVLVRDAGRRQHRPVRNWPARLRNKWIGLALFAAVLFAYELFDLWALPRATAWLILGYFAAALAIDLLFTGATFCKYLCPIGQFNFTASTLSPLEVAVREPAVCATCRTVDCIRGRRDAGAPGVTIQRGCELGLFLPAKVGNVDCTFCLDCVQACPHDNVAIAARLPGAELVDGRRRSGIGRLAARPDIAALAVLFTFGALLNAFAMVRPVYVVEQRLARVLHVSVEAPVLLVVFVVALGLIPAALLIGASASSRLIARSHARSLRDDITQYATGLIPFGFGLWIAHYAFHFLTGVLTIVPVTQSAAADLFGWALLGDPLWKLAGMRPGAVFPIQIGFVMLGTLGSLAVTHGISEREHPGRPLAATAPWAVVLLLIAAAALWVLSSPMEMRGIGFLG
jgi:polyferredoxin